MSKKAAVVPSAISVPAEVIPKRWLNVDEAAVYLGVCRGTVLNILRRGELRAVQRVAGSPYSLDIHDLDRYQESHKKLIPPYRRGSHPWVAKRWKDQRRKRTAQ